MDERHRAVSELASAALDLAMTNRLEEAELSYRAAVDSARAINHHGLSDYETQLAEVLARRGADAEAEEFYRRAVTDALSRHSDESASAVGIARYFLAEFLVSRARGTDALETLAPGLEHAKSLEAILRFVEAQALWIAGQHDAARAAADRAIASAATEEQRDRMRGRFVKLDGWVRAV